MSGRRERADTHRLEFAGVSYPLRPGVPVTFGRGTDREASPVQEVPAGNSVVRHRRA